MIRSEQRPSGRWGQSPAQLERDAALQRVSRTRRWVVAGAAALSAAVAALVSMVAPGHSYGAKGRAQLAQDTSQTTRSSRTLPSRSASSVPRMPPLASPAQLGLASPASAPQPVSPSQASPAQSQASPDQSQASPDQSQPAPDQSQAVTPAPAQSAPAPAPAPQPAAVSGGS